MTITLNERVRTKSEVIYGDHDSSSMQASTENPGFVHKPLHQSLNKDLVKIIHFNRIHTRVSVCRSSYGSNW